MEDNAIMSVLQKNAPGAEEAPEPEPESPMPCRDDSMLPNQLRRSLMSPLGIKLFMHREDAAAAALCRASFGGRIRQRLEDEDRVQIELD